MRRTKRQLWAVVLAGGSGTRLAPLTTALYGFPLPKQYAVFDGRRSLLQQTLDRVLGLVPENRIVVVAAAEHQAFARKQLVDRPGITLVLQPKNLDTGPGILLGLSFVLARDEHAAVAVFPSDHYIPNAAPVLEAVRDLSRRAAEGAWDLALLGAEAHHPETDYGWIVPGPTEDPTFPSLRPVVRFVEKPGPLEASSLLAQRSLWNTFIFVGLGSRMWKLAETCLPMTHRFGELRRRIRTNTAQSATFLDDLYRELPAANWSRDVLSRGERLAVVSVCESGWSDWGSPERVTVLAPTRSAA